LTADNGSKGEDSEVSIEVNTVEAEVSIAVNRNGVEVEASVAVDGNKVKVEVSTADNRYGVEAEALLADNGSGVEVESDIADVPRCNRFGDGRSSSPKPAFETLRLWETRPGDKDTSAIESCSNRGQSNTPFKRMKIFCCDTT